MTVGSRNKVPVKFLEVELISGVIVIFLSFSVPKYRSSRVSKTFLPLCFSPVFSKRRSGESTRDLGNDLNFLTETGGLDHLCTSLCNSSEKARKNYTGVPV